jgi:hypothetical protein
MSRLRRLRLVTRVCKVVRLRENGTWTKHNLVRSAKLKNSVNNTVELIRYTLMIIWTSEISNASLTIDSINE